MKKYLLKFYYRFLFFYKFKTLKKLKIINKETICLPSSKGIFKVARKCPNQGAFLENAFIHDYIIECHWHGCKLNISTKGKKL